MNFLKIRWLGPFLFLGVAAIFCIVNLNYMIATAWMTDLYGRPVTIFAVFQDGLLNHPDWLWNLPWGKEFSGLYLWQVLTLALVAFTVQHMSWWKWGDLIDVPWEYFAAVLPFLILAMGIVSVGGHRAGFGFEMFIPIKDNWTIYQAFRDGNATFHLVEVPNYLYANSSHFCAAFSMGAVTIPWALHLIFGKDENGKLRMSVALKMLFWAFVFIALFAHWEHIENLFQLFSGGPTVGGYNPFDESLANMAFDTLGFVCSFALYAACQMVGKKDWYVNLSLYRAVRKRILRTENRP